MKRRGWRSHTARLLALTFALTLGLALALFAFVPTASAHALPVKTDPAARELVQAPPPRVMIQYSENVNRQVANISVLDTARHRVDNNDTQVDPADAHIVSVSLPLLKPGTYTVVWRVESADDGHVSNGSYYFQVARADGSAPPGSTPGDNGGADAGVATIDGPSLFQAIATWITLVLLTVWVGGLIWETWIAGPTISRDPDLATAAQASAQRFRALAPTVLGLLVVADVAVVLGQAAAVAGDWSGTISPTYLRAVLFGSRYGAFWWLRQIVALVALYLTGVAGRREWASARAIQNAGENETREVASGAIPDWRRELVATLRGVGKLPSRLVAGWRARSWLGQVELLLAALLVLAFALTGHAAAVSADRFPFAFSVDLLHLLANCAWLGGLFYISLVFVPALGKLAPRGRMRALAIGLPEFGVVAILSATLLAATGSLNATVRMTSFGQLLTTTYGLTLVIKILLFLLMAAISVYHAFWLRPRLASALVAEGVAAPETVTASVAVASSGVSSDLSGGQESTNQGVAQAGNGGSPGGVSTGIRTLGERLEDWLRREAFTGVGVLLCAALLGAFAGSLATAPAPIAGASSGAYVNTQPAGDYSVTLKVAPAKFGANTFLVTLKDKDGKPVDGASVLLQTTMLDMEMGTQSLQLQPIGADSPGTYGGQADLDMGGDWGLAVKVIPPGATDFQTATFKIVVGY
jgi:methionine-rich copper-binding protein CopC/putative copper export protein